MIILIIVIITATYSTLNYVSTHKVLVEIRVTSWIGRGTKFYTGERVRMALGPTKLSFSNYKEVFCRGLEHAERQPDHSPPSSAQVKNV
jgi:hypothetical protein